MLTSYPPDAPPAFHLLAKPTGATCNLDCGYCFFLSKEMLYPGSRFRMADEMLETYIRQLIEAHRTGRRVLPPLCGAGRKVSAAGHDLRVHHPDQRHTVER